ncbi:hypothetical protein BI334_28315 [Moorena producens 3L]|nr:hypothetical protein BI334_28315 [Moorena producens 3L]
MLLLVAARRIGDRNQALGIRSTSIESNYVVELVTFQQHNRPYRIKEFPTPYPSEWVGERIAFSPKLVSRCCPQSR